MSSKTMSRLFPVGAAVLIATTGLLVAGPLNPPTGPIASTGKTLTEVEPRIAINATNTPGDADSIFRITQPGSYYLVGNVTGVSNKHGIEIAASGVKVDLNGFEVLGVPGSLNGITTSLFDSSHIRIENGSIRNWSGHGIDMLTQPSSGDIERVNSSDNIGRGIRAHSGRISECQMRGNDGGGIKVNTRSLIERCVMSGNALQNIEAGDGCTISDCVAIGNVNGIVVGNYCTISNCTVGEGSSAWGIKTQSYCTISNCTVTNITGTGIDTENGSTVLNCTVSDCYSGIVANAGCQIVSCTTSSCGNNGITAYDDSLISGCVSSYNSGDGIQVIDNCKVLSCVAMGNGTVASFGAGVRVTGAGNVVDGNSLTSNRYGLTVPGTSALIVRNTCRTNALANFDIGPNNNYGPVIDRRSTFGAAFSGSAAASSLGSTDPNANFAY